MRGFILVAMLGLVGLPGVAGAREDDIPLPDLGQTWVEIGGEVYGARPNELGPIGGGKGYARLVTDGNYRVKDIDGLLEALKKAQPGEVVFIEPGVELDFTALVYTENMVVRVPGGVTLAGNRGQDGAPGATLCSDAFQTCPLVEAMGPNVRITGLRLRGPDPKTRMDHHRRAFTATERPGGLTPSAYYYKFPISEGIRTAFAGLEVDNCEVSGWSHGGIHLADGDGHHVHHCFIHHNQYNGLGYGVVHGYGEKSGSLIEYNVFDFNRHSIAATGKPGNAYEAGNNVEVGHAISHYFDMHGGGDRGDGTNIAGDWMKFHHNTFLSATQKAILIRGVPRQEADIHHNWFAAAEPGPAVIGPWPPGGETHVVVHDNAYGTDKPEVKDKGE